MTKTMYTIQSLKIKKSHRGPPHSEWQVRRSLSGTFESAYAMMTAGRRKETFILYTPAGQLEPDGATYYRRGNGNNLAGVYIYRIAPVEIDVSI